MSAGRALKVWINERQVGTLASQDDIWRFQYAPSWPAFDKRFALAAVFELRADAFCGWLRYVSCAVVFR